MAISLCHVCGVESSKFARKCLFEDHVRSHQNDTKFLCPYCGKSFPKYYSLLMHQDKYHSSFRKGNFELLECFKEYPDLYNKFEECWMSITDCDTLLSKPGKKTMAMREEYALACEKFCKIFPKHFDRPLTRKMHSLSFVLPWHVRNRGLYYEFLCLEQAGERAHCRPNEAVSIFANIQPQEKRYFLMMKYLKNKDRSEISVL